jgi:hypothetical protein
MAVFLLQRDRNSGKDAPGDNDQCGGPPGHKQRENLPGASAKRGVALTHGHLAEFIAA